MDSSLEEDVAQEVLDRQEYQVWIRKRMGKSDAALAQLYRCYEGENGIREALEGMQARINARLAGEADATANVDQRSVVAAVADIVGAEALSGPDERMNGAGGAPEHVARTPPRATPPAPPRIVTPPVKLALEDRSPATANGGSQMQSDRKAKEDRAVEFVKAHGPASTMEIARAANIAKGSITHYLRRLCAEGRLERVGGSFQGGVSRPPQPQERPRTPARSAAAARPSSVLAKSAATSPGDGVQSWLKDLDRDALGVAIEEMRGRLAAYEEFAAALDRIAELAAA